MLFSFMFCMLTQRLTNIQTHFTSHIYFETQTVLCYHKEHIMMQTCAVDSNNKMRQTEMFSQLFL